MMAKKEAAAKAAKTKTAKTEKAAKPAKVAKADAPAKAVKPPKAAKAEKPPKAEKAPKPPKPPKKSKATLAAEKALSEDNKKWSELKEKHGSEKAQTYSMSGGFEPGKPLMHKVLGWGYITNILNDRLEVLFETGAKILISNYKSN
jgi:hypothetical protein